MAIKAAAAVEAEARGSQIGQEAEVEAGRRDDKLKRKSVDNQMDGTIASWSRSANRTKESCQR